MAGVVTAGVVNAGVVAAGVGVVTGAVGRVPPFAGGAGVATGAAGGSDGGEGGPTWTDGPVASVEDDAGVAELRLSDQRLTFAPPKAIPYDPGPPLNGDPVCSHSMICAPRPEGSHFAPSVTALRSVVAADPESLS